MFGLPAEQNVTLSPTPTPVAPKVAQAQTPAEQPRKGLAPRAAEAAPQEIVPPPAPVNEIPKFAQGEPVSTNTSISDTALTRDGQSLRVTVTTEGPASKVIASYGKQGVMLQPTSDKTWEGSIPISALTESEQQLTITAYDLGGIAAATRVASFSQSLPNSYAPVADPKQHQVEFLGYNFDPNRLTQNFYLLFVAGMLGAMILAIGIKRHIQHVHMIANGSFVAALAILLWWMG